MTKQILLIGDKKYYIHPVFTNYATSKKDGQKYSFEYLK